MAESVHKNRIGRALRIALAFHLLIFVVGILGFDGGDLTEIALYALIPFWSMVALIAWKRKAQATRVDYVLIAYGYPILFGGYFLWNAVAE